MIKAALMNTAEDLGLFSYEQGSGRINVYRSAVTPILVISPSLSFRHIFAGVYTLNATLYNIGTSSETVSVNLVTQQTSDKTERPYVSSNITQPVTIPTGGRTAIELILNLPLDAP
jgi:hypothetical protein